MMMIIVSTDVHQPIDLPLTPNFEANIVYMNQAHLHLLLNHLPIIGTVIGMVVLLGGFILRQPRVKQTSLAIFVFAAICSIPSFLTGEGAEEVVEGLGVIDEAFIETHEDLGSLYLWILGGLGIVSLLTLIVELRGNKKTGFLYAFILALSLVSIGVSARLAVSGGEIRHTEIRSDSITQATQGGEHGEKEDED